MKKLGILIVALFLGLTSFAAAADYYVDVTNDTGFTIYYLYVSHTSSDEWEEDVLESDVISDGETYRVTLRGYKTPIFDIKAEDEEGDTYTFYNIDVSKQDITITLADLD